jgi:hypothetical protein
MAPVVPIVPPVARPAAIPMAMGRASARGGNAVLNTCRSCSARVIWVEMAATGRRMPLNPTPDPKGNVSIDSQTGKARVVQAGAVGRPGPRYMPHFATCPQAGKHRR